MKQTNVFSFALIGMLTMQVFLSACDSPKQREETIDPKIQDNVVQISDLKDITSESEATKAYFYTSSNNGEISLADKTAQIQADETTLRVLSMIKNEETKKALDAHLSKGLIGFVIMSDEVQVYKVLTKAEASTDESAHSTVGLLEIKKMKKTSLDSANQKTAAAQIDLTESKNDVEYVKIAAIKIEKSGVLENKRTVYDEKTSLLTVSERPLEVSTHLLLKPEKATEQPSTR